MYDDMTYGMMIILNICFTQISGFSVARPVRFAGDAELVPLDREVRCSNLQMNNCHDVGDHEEHAEHETMVML